ncbi:TonB-dependent receptor plug domain-containing protein [Teredinibacter waterburyi]|jgi:Outer membrane receptor proteins, mostly Fe transport|uniref:TonB-dependent receptor plug domain-containing protein n=1 Tax=Teredinibacter waterburyi TaxID=1500538 RepID=UPI00165F4B48|nr:TonB-dependent receptor [Teredinibacter waterburyi]
MRKQNHLSLAVRAALLGLASSSLLAPHSFAQDDDGNSDKLEEMVVTGSHIKRSEFQQGSQVVGIDRTEIDALGSLMVADVLRSSPLNSYGSFSERSGSSAQSNATINLRGLGDERTLVTIDGRRMVGSPNLGAAVINVNMIPMAAVERVDILADGASAVYGSDAVAGVVNMMMRKNVDGIEFSARYGDRSNDDGSEHSLSLVGGIDGDKGNVTFAIESSHRDPIWDRDREYTAPWTRDTEGDGVIDAYVDTDGYSIYGASIAIWDPNTEYDRIQAATSCQEGNGFLGVVDADIDWLAPSDLNENTYCMYGYADVSANKAELDKLSTYVNVDYQINDNMDFYMTSIASRVESFGRFAPPAASWDDMPADYPDVPFDIDALLDAGTITEDYELTGYYRWTNIGPRDNYVTDTQFDVSMGLKGDINENISYDVYLQNSQYDVKEYGYYYLSYPGLDYVMSQGIDPFSEEGAGAMSATTTQDNYTKMFKSYGQLQFGVGDLLGAGEAIVVTGVENISMTYQNKYDRASETGFVGGSSGNSSTGDREILALFSEILLPVTEGVEVNAALRYDSYSDYGTSVSPTLSVSWVVTDDIVLRSRIGQGFRAPGLDELYGPASFSAESASDQLGCSLNDIAPEDCGSSQYDTYFETSKDLDAETSESFSMGMNWEANSNITLDLSYWLITIDDKISQPQTQDVFDAEIAGFDFSQTPGTYVDRSGGKPIVYSRYMNEGTLEASGLDMQLDASMDTKYGHLGSNLLLTQSLSYKQPIYVGGPTQETKGFNLQPKTKAQLALNWSLGQNRVDFIIDYVGGSGLQDTIEFVDPADATQGTKRVTTSEKLDSWTTMNLSYSYDASQYGTIKLGGRNITNEDPVLDRNGKFDETHYDLYDATGRVFYLEYTLKL